MIKINYVQNELIDEEVALCIEDITRSVKKNKSVKIYRTDNIEALDKVAYDTSKHKIIVTKNVTPEFVTKAVEITENIVYRGDNVDNIKEKIINILEKSNTNEK